MAGKRIPIKEPAVYEASPFDPLYDLNGARDGLGFEAQHDIRERLERQVDGTRQARFAG